jgi:chromosome partitioning protein
MRAKVILVGNEKGGSGKTTLATNLAVIGAAAGLDVLLVDADPGQASSSLWAAMRSSDHPDLPRVTCVEIRASRDVRPQIITLSEKFDLILIDTGAMDSPHLRASALVADVLVVPVQSDQLDIWALPAIASIYEGSQERNPGLRAHIVLNRLLYHTAADKPAELQAWMQEHVPELPSDHIPALVARAAYGKASGEGLAVTELQRKSFDPKAAAEMMAVYQEVLR